MKLSHSLCGTPMARTIFMIKYTAIYIFIASLFPTYGRTAKRMSVSVVNHNALRGLLLFTTVDMTVKNTMKHLSTIQELN